MKGIGRKRGKCQSEEIQKKVNQFGKKTGGRCPESVKKDRQSVKRS